MKIKLVSAGPNIILDLLVIVNRIVNNTKWNRLRMNIYGSKNTSNSPTTLNIPPFWTFFKSILVVILVKSNQTGKFKWFLICFFSENGYLLVTKVFSNFIPKACRTLDGFRAHSIMIFGRIEVAFFKVTNFIFLIILNFLYMWEIGTMPGTLSREAEEFAIELGTELWDTGTLI